MYLARLYIKNYKSIKELDLNLQKGKNIIIGKNNTGKSNIIKAIDLVLGEANPTYLKAENITEDDFHSCINILKREEIINCADDIFIWCELNRDRSEPLDYDELYKCFGFYIYGDIIEWVERRPIKESHRISCSQLPNKYYEVFEISEDENQGKEYINPKQKSKKVLESQFEDKFFFALALRAKKTSEGEILKEMRFFYREDNSSDWVMSFRAPIRNEFLQSAIIPSFRDPQSQLRLSKWTWFGKLMHNLTSKHEKSPELIQAFESAKSIGNEIFHDVREKVKESSLDVAFPGTDIYFQFNVDSKSELYKNCIIYIDDGFKSKITDKGSGIQSATIIGLFNYYTHNINSITSALLCVEEPELYLHPHACRVISDRLDEFLYGNKNQVILTTHSTEFIRTTSDDLNIILVRKGKNGTEAISMKIERYKELMINKNMNELFFADKVIICEGFDEFILTAIAKELYPNQLDEKNISIIAASSKDRISRIAELIIKLGIKCFVIADFDYLLRDTSKDREKYKKKSHQSIINLGSNFFKQEYIFGKDGVKIVSELQILRQDLKRDNEEAFYTAKNQSCFKNPRISATLKTLRKNGICILSGEIEDCSRDPFISPKDKLSLDKIYELNSRLASGEKITDLFDVSEINDFLYAVLAR